MSMKKLLIPLLVAITISSTLSAQQNLIASNVEISSTAEISNNSTSQNALLLEHKFDVGVGFGLDYGGAGARFGYVPVKRLMVFASAGYIPKGFGWQLGAMFHIMPKDSKHVARPYISAMYGTNAYILVKDSHPKSNLEHSDIYLGPSFGAGVELRFGSLKHHGIDVAIYYPLRSQEFEDNLDYVKNEPYINGYIEPWKINLSLGYHYEF